MGTRGTLRGPGRGRPAKPFNRCIISIICWVTLSYRPHRCRYLFVFCKSSIGRFSFKNDVSTFDIEARRMCEFKQAVPEHAQKHVLCSRIRLPLVFIRFHFPSSWLASEAMPPVINLSFNQVIERHKPTSSSSSLLLLSVAHRTDLIRFVCRLLLVWSGGWETTYCVGLPGTVGCPGRL